MFHITNAAIWAPKPNRYVFFQGIELKVGPIFGHLPLILKKRHMSFIFVVPLFLVTEENIHEFNLLMIMQLCAWNNSINMIL